MFAILLCISFFSYRMMEFYSDNVVSESRLVEYEKENIIQEESIINTTNIHTLDQNDQQSFYEVVSLMFNSFDEEDKGYSVSGIHKSMVFFMISLILIQHFLCVRRWLIKTFHILKYNIPFVVYLHKKDGKKKCVPSYGQIC